MSTKVEAIAFLSGGVDAVSSLTNSSANDGAIGLVGQTLSTAIAVTARTRSSRRSRATCIHSRQRQEVRGESW